MLLLPIRLLLFVLVNLLLAPRNLARAIARRREVWLTVRLEGAVAERPPKRRLFRRARAVTVAGLHELAVALEREPNVRGVVLEIEPLHVGWARVESLRGAVAAIRARGKRVVAHLSSPGNQELLLACAADEVLADESGAIALTGLAIEAGFYGEALGRLGVDPQLDRMGDYKSFADTFTRSDMTPAHREALEAILDGYEGALLEGLAAGRRVDRARARALVDGGPYLPHDALAAGLLDGVLYRDELPAHLGKAQGTKARLVPHDRFLVRRPRWYRPPLFRRPRALAVLSLEGAITSGEGNDLVQKALGAESAVRALAGLRASARVAAVVLRVDSRGGSAPASDRIWREVQRLAEAKPVVAYLDDVAASGGYYLVAPATAIVAQPTTLTGSIGVVGGKIAVERLLDRLGVRTVTLQRGSAAAMHSPRRRFDDAERAKLHAEIEGIYRQFVGKVAAGRKLPLDRVEAAARGRVWTGADAQRHGLVDALGGIDVALKLAEEKAPKRAGERLLVRDVAPSPKRQGLLRMLAGRPLGASLPSIMPLLPSLARLLPSLDVALPLALAEERVLAWADGLPEVR